MDQPNGQGNSLVHDLAYYRARSVGLGIDLAAAREEITQLLTEIGELIGERDAAVRRAKQLELDFTNREMAAREVRNRMTQSLASRRPTRPSRVTRPARTSDAP